MAGVRNLAPNGQKKGTVLEGGVLKNEKRTEISNLGFLLERTQNEAGTWSLKKNNGGTGGKLGVKVHQARGKMGAPKKWKPPNPN